MSEAGLSAVSSGQAQRGSPGRALDPWDKETEPGSGGTKERAAQRQRSNDPQRPPRSIETEHSSSSREELPRDPRRGFPRSRRAEWPAAAGQTHEPQQ